MRRAPRVLLARLEPPLVCLPAGVRRPSPTSCPRLAAPSICAVANAVGLSLPRAPVAVQSVSGGAVAGIVGWRPRRARCVSTIVRIGLAWEARYNESVETDTQRQGAARRVGKSYAPRRLAAGCGSPSRYSGGSCPALSQGDCGPRALCPPRARRSVGSSRPRPALAPGTAAGCRPQDVRVHPGTPRPERATSTLCIAASAAGFMLPARSCESEGRRSRLPQAPSDVGRSGPRQCERPALGGRQKPRHNEAVDSDAQLRTLPAVAPVGRRSPLR